MGQVLVTGQDIVFTRVEIIEQAALLLLPQEIVTKGRITGRQMKIAELLICDSPFQAKAPAK